MITVKVKILAGLKDKIGSDEIELLFDRPVSIRRILEALCEKFNLKTEDVFWFSILRPDLRIFVDGVDYLILGGLDAVIEKSCEIVLLGVSHGG